MAKNNKKSKSKKIQGYIFFGLVLVIAIYGFVHSRIGKYQLEVYPETKKGVITDKYSIRSRGTFVNYKFLVNKKKYKGSTRLNKNTIHLNIGDSLGIIFSIKNPEYNKITQ